jgi:hypothetical protein
MMIISTDNKRIWLVDRGQRGIQYWAEDGKPQVLSFPPPMGYPSMPSVVILILSSKFFNTFTYTSTCVLPTYYFITQLVPLLNNKGMFG